MKEYQTVVGLEVHIQMNTVTKAFCADALSFGAEPNSHVSAISLAHPGTLPKVNNQHVKNAISLGLALGSKINQTNTFDRKHYYYADLPKAYQITQDRLPICVGGFLDIIPSGGKKKSIRINRIHMEEDAGKTIHDQDPDYSLVDLNRAGTPLLELVTEPDLHSGEEVLSFIAELQKLVRYLEISDGDMEKGSLRCDVNVSVMPRGSEELGERCEVKNVNSKKFAKAAVEYESKRQIRLLEQGVQFSKQTLHFNPITGATSSLRDKEDADDYRYFPDPDLPPVKITDDELEVIKKNQPALPWVVKQMMKDEYHLSEYNSSLLSEDKEVANYFFQLDEKCSDSSLLANLIINKILPVVGLEGIAKYPVSDKSISSFISLLKEEKVGISTANQKLWPEVLKYPSANVEELARDLNILQIEDYSVIQNIVNEVLTQNADQAQEYRNGKKKVLGFLIGQAMRKSRGATAPEAVKKALIRSLDTEEINGE